MLIPDQETAVDFLNCEAISQTVVQILTDNRTRPLTVGIHGDWGAGKSSVLKMIEKDLVSDKQVACLWFNGWTFEGFDDAKIVLIEATINELCRQRSTIGKVKEKAADLLRRVSWLKVAKRGGGLAFNVLTGLPSPDQIETALTTLKGMAQNVGDIAAEDIPGRLEEISSYLKPGNDGESLPDTIHNFRIDFQALLEEAKIDQLVVLIDDLDRCLPKTAIETLEAIRLFLFVPKTAFVIGADEAMIEYAVRQHFPDLPLASGPVPYSRNYLEKLVQIPFRIPALGAQETRTYVTLLLVQSLVGDDHDGFNQLRAKAREGSRKPWIGTGLSQSDVQAVDKTQQGALDAAFVMAQQIAPMLAEGTKGNPRQVKRFLNALLVRQVIARASGFGDLINQPVLAKLMLAERFQPDFYEHIATQAMTAPDGKATDITSLEDLAKHAQTEKEKKGVGEDKTAKPAAKPKRDLEKWFEREWLKSWLGIAPMIESVDLRPYVFVARDKRLLAGALGLGGLDALIDKLSGAGLELRSAEKQVKSLPAGDADIVFRSLRERVLSAGSFQHTPKGMDGLSIVAKHHSQFQNEVVNLLGGLEPKGLGLWAVKGWNESITAPDAQTALEAVLQQWANQNENALLKQAAAAAAATLSKGPG